MPCFEGLFPQPFEKVILDLLFMLGTWHALAKLRIHSTSSLSFFDGVTKSLGQVLRCFTDFVCPNFKTHETPAEAARRARRAAAKAAKQKDSEGHSAAAPTGQNEQSFNLETYKIHALGHYPLTIRQFGTTDSYSTQTVECSCFRLLFLSYIYVGRT